MAGGIVGWQFFDVESGLVPEGSSHSTIPNGGKGRVVVLASTPFALSSGWAARAAVALAKDWAGEGLKVFLMDLGLLEPSIHLALDIPNREGVSDAFLFGASVQHIAKPVPDAGFFFAPAGSLPGDPEEVLGHSRWNDLAGGFSEANATLLLLLPTTIPGAAKILSRATDIVFLSAQGESADAHLGPAAIKVHSMMGPFGSPPEEVPVAGGAAEDEPEGIDEPAAPEEVVEDAFSAGFDLAEGFGADADEESPDALSTDTEVEDETPSFDFSGGIELDSGFGMAEEQDDSVDPVEGAADVSAESGDGSDFSGDFGLLEAEPSQEFGGDLVPGAGFSGGFGDDDDDSSFDGGSPPPDFGSEFVDMGAGDAPDSGDGQFGGDLVQGADFGSEPSGGMYAESTDLPAESSPDKGSSADSSDDPPTPAPSRPAPKRRPPPKKKFPFGMVFGIVVILAAVGTVAGSAFGYLNIPALAFLQDYFSDIPDPPLTLAGPEPNEEVLRFSLVLFNYDEGEVADATNMMDALKSRLPDLLFSLVLGEEEGEIVYSLMVGPATDRIEAEDLRAPLAEVLNREDSGSWTVRETPRAFYLGGRETLADAEEYMASLSFENIYSYILHVTYPDGSEGYEILSGAFAGVEDARPLQLSLRGGGFRDVPLIERRGRPPE